MIIADTIKIDILWSKRNPPRSGQTNIETDWIEDNTHIICPLAWGSACSKISDWYIGAINDWRGTNNMKREINQYSGCIIDIKTKTINTPKLSIYNNCLRENFLSQNLFRRKTWLSTIIIPTHAIRYQEKDHDTPYSFVRYKESSDW